MWIAPVRSSEVFACSRSLQVRHVFCWIKTTAPHVPCPAQHSALLYLTLYSSGFSPEEPLSHLIWYEPQVVAHRPKLPANAFIQFTTFFLKEKGNSCSSKDHSQTAGRRLGAASQAAAAARSGDALPAGPGPRRGWQRPSNCILFFQHRTHWLVSGSGFS